MGLQLIIPRSRVACYVHGDSQAPLRVYFEMLIFFTEKEELRKQALTIGSVWTLIRSSIEENSCKRHYQDNQGQLNKVLLLNNYSFYYK